MFLITEMCEAIAVCLTVCLSVCHISNVSTTIDPYWDISLDLGPPDFEGMLVITSFISFIVFLSVG